MGIRDLLLKKGRGVGELKNIRTSHSLNADIITRIKELDQLDREAEVARSRKDYGRLLSIIHQQLALIDRVDYYSLVRLIRLEYDYKDMDSALKGYEDQARKEEDRIRSEEKRLRQIQEPQRSQVKAHIDNARQQVQHFRQRVKSGRDRISSLKSTIKDKCRKKIVKVKKALYFA